jgi:CRISPR/Cas system-associated exonuclease Cas4 (RecB family)
MTSRFERKYLVKNSDLDLFREAIQPFVEPDTFGVSNGKAVSEYVVRSIYFDTADFKALHEKIDGVKERKKLRVRGYNSYAAGNKVFLEIKRKSNDRISKNRALVSFDSLQDSLDFGEILSKDEHYPDSMIQDANKFFYYLKLHHMRPVCLVTYNREAFMGKFDESLRITFDKNINVALFPKLTDLYREDILTPVWTDCFILEVKYFEKKMPHWLRILVDRFKLERKALSKFASAFSSTEISMLNSRF